MDILGAFKSICCATVSTIKKSVIARTNIVVGGVKYVAGVVTNDEYLKFVGSQQVEEGIDIQKEMIGTAWATGVKAYDCFTGKKVWQEAKKNWDELEKEVKKENHETPQFINKKIEGINSCLDSIYELRKLLANDLFPAFKEVSNNFAEWEICTTTFKEFCTIKNIQVHRLKPRESVFKIDFEHHPIKNNLMALATLGFATCKQAAETLTNIEAEKKVFEKKQANNDAEKKRYSILLKSLKDIVHYLEEMISFYRSLIEELKYAANTLHAAYALSRPNWYSGKLDCYFLPHRHILCLMSADKMTRILHQMAMQKYMGKNSHIIMADFDNCSESNKVFSSIKEKLAA